MIDLVDFIKNQNYYIFLFINKEMTNSQRYGKYNELIPSSSLLKLPQVHKTLPNKYEYILSSKYNTSQNNIKLKSNRQLQFSEIDKQKIRSNSIIIPLREKYELNQQKIPQLESLWNENNIPFFYSYYFLQILKKKSTLQKHQLILKQIKTIKEKKHCFYLEAMDFIKARETLFPIILNYFDTQFTQQKVVTQISNYSSIIQNQANQSNLTENKTKSNKNSLFIILKQIKTYRMLTIRVINIINQWEKWLRYHDYIDYVQFIHDDEDYLYKIHQSDSNEIAATSGFFEKNPFFIFKKQYQKGDIELVYNVLKPDLKQAKQLLQMLQIIELHTSTLNKYKVEMNAKKKKYIKQQLILQDKRFKSVEKQSPSNSIQKINPEKNHSPKRTQNILPQRNFKIKELQESRTKRKILDDKAKGTESLEKAINYQFENVQVQQNGVLQFLEKVFLQQKSKGNNKIDYYLRVILAHKQAIIIKITENSKLIGLIIGQEGRLSNYRQYFHILEFIKFSSINQSKLIQYLTTFNKYYYIKNKNQELQDIPIEPTSDQYKAHIKIKILFKIQKQNKKQLKKFMIENPNISLIYNNKQKFAEYYQKNQDQISFVHSITFDRVVQLSVINQKSKMQSYYKIKVDKAISLKFSNENVMGYRLIFYGIKQYLQIYYKQQKNEVIEYENIKKYEQKQQLKNVDLLIPTTSIKFEYQSITSDRILFEEYVKINNPKTMRLSLIRYQNKFTDAILIKFPYILKIFNNAQEIYMAKIQQ